MTSAAPARRTRWSKRSIRILAWLTGGATFVMSGAVLATAPKPAPRASTRGPAAPKRVVTIERRIVIVPADGSTADGDGPTVVTGSGGGAASDGGATSTGGS
ncbi:MAG TPA: hypothetical protein VFT09_00625 [Ilumatobacteraceae bacterium]|nr:hypothetical protein [Ilumatobacteraceae bacterium]